VSGLDLGEGGSHLLGVGHVAAHTQCPRWGVPAARGDGDVVPELEERLGDGCTDASTAAGDQY